jgi:glycosyltransferase involved in cell wall biosynthesis
MKIAYDSQIFCAQTYGGVSRYFCEIASRIAKQPGVQVSITAPMHINAYLAHMPPGIVSGFRAPETERFQTNYGVNYPRLALRGLGLLVGDWMLRAMNPDIVHETYFFPYRLGPRRARRVLTIHDMIHEKFASSFPLADKTSRHKALAAERADHVICVSESTRRDAIEILGLPPDKTSVIYHGCDLMKVDGASAGELVLPTLEPFLLYVGNRGGYKNFLRMLEAYGASPQLKTGYKLICFGGGAFHADELKTMQTLGLDSGQVMQLGGNDQLLAKLYERASAFIYPSLYEGFGIPPLEAMSHDCPVVCSNTSSIPEVVGDAGEYFDPADTESIRAAIERVVESISHQQSLIAKGRARLECFSWDRCAAETLGVYMKLV